MKRKDIVSKYPAGTRIVLEHMKGEPQMEQGLMGTVTYIDDACQIHMKWDNGCALALNAEEDRFEIIREMISVVYVEPLCFPRTLDMENTLSSIQKAVNGPIEYFYPFKDERIVFIVNEEGKYTQLPNRVVYSDDGEICDIIHGPFVISGIDNEGNLTGLCEEEAGRFMNMFIESEMFLEIQDGQMIVIKSCRVEMI